MKKRVKFLADVNIPQSVIISLQNHGYDVLDIKRENKLLSDIDLVKQAQLEERIILTKDKDFISLTQFPKYQVATIAIRLSNQKPANMEKYLLELLENQKEALLTKSLTIVEDEVANSLPF